jgi:hypothetical protein
LEPPSPVPNPLFWIVTAPKLGVCRGLETNDRHCARGTNPLGWKLGWRKTGFAARSPTWDRLETVFWIVVGMVLLEKRGRVGSNEVASRMKSGNFADGTLARAASAA